MDLLCKGFNRNEYKEPESVLHANMQFRETSDLSMLGNKMSGASAIQIYDCL